MTYIIIGYIIGIPITAAILGYMAAPKKKDSHPMFMGCEYDDYGSTDIVLAFAWPFIVFAIIALYPMAVARAAGRWIKGRVG